MSRSSRFLFGPKKNGEPEPNCEMRKGASFTRGLRECFLWWNQKMVKSIWSHLHVHRSLQHDDQKWNKLAKMPVNHEKLLEYPSMKRSNPLVSDTAKRLSWCSVSSCEMSGSGVLLLECTMWRQRPSTSSRSPTRPSPIFSRNFNMKGASSAKAKLGYG